LKGKVGLKFEITFNPTFVFVHILPKFGFKQPSIVYSAFELQQEPMRLLFIVHLSFNKNQWGSFPCYTARLNFNKNQWGLFPCYTARLIFNKNQWGSFPCYAAHTLKKCWVVSTQIWVKYGNPNVGLKMQLKKI